MVETEPRTRAGAAPVAGFLVCSLVWGSTFLFISIGNDTVPPVWAATIRLALATVLLGAIALLARQRFPRGRDLITVGLYGLFGFGVNFSLLYWAERVVPSSLAAVLYATIPLTTALISGALRVERLSRRTLAGSLLGLAGVVTIFSDQLTAGAVVPTLALLGGASFAAYAGVLLHRAGTHPPFMTNAVASAVGFVFCLLVSLVAGEAHAIPAGMAEWFPILYLTVAGSGIAYVVMVWLINVWGANRTSFITLVIPVVAVTLGMLVRDERLPPLAFVGAAIVLAGVYLGVSGRRAA